MKHVLQELQYLYAANRWISPLCCSVWLFGECCKHRLQWIHYVRYDRIPNNFYAGNKTSCAFTRSHHQ